MRPAPVPQGTFIVPDPGTKQVAEDRLVGGTPTRMLRLTDAGRAAWRELRDGAVTSPMSAVLARRLTDSGLAHPRPTAGSEVDVTVVIPVHGRADELDRCLTAVGDQVFVVVVDDGSSDPDRIAAIAARHGATLIRREANGGPAAARNTGVTDIESDLVAFLDSDCVASPDWIEQLSGHFADPLVAAAAPRIVSNRAAQGRYLASCSTLDLGPHESRVHPKGRVTYVPTAALVVRRAALDAVGGFDPDLRYGEDVDLVWRLDAAGWRVRYDPSVRVAHDEAASWPDRITRRYRYGTSAAPLSQRHPGALTHLVSRPWPLVAVAGVIARRPLITAAGVAATATATRRSLRRAEVTDLGVARATASSLAGAWLGLGRYATQFTAPLLVAAAAGPGRRRSRSLMVAALAVAPPLVDWSRSRPAVTPARYLAGRVTDDIAYGVGVHAGCLRHRTAAPLLPSSTRQRFAAKSETQQ
ncbi:MAG TPA: mycofactocin biosynthesis glycosyltransferase MftF [Mycobacteriales bacterium]|nr:mycofactocin biosynthesis glycosyltransferase MftF [Mycobacteriales bacterium]